jgi:hypothetical protein
MTALNAILQVAIHTVQIVSERLIEGNSLELILQSCLSLEEFGEHTDVTRSSESREVSHDKLGIALCRERIVVTLVAQYHMSLLEGVVVTLLRVNLQTAIHKENNRIGSTLLKLNALSCHQTFDVKTRFGMLQSGTSRWARYLHCRFV